jgi:hypothetical protein
MLPFTARWKAGCQAGRTWASYFLRRTREPWFPRGVDELLDPVTPYYCLSVWPFDLPDQVPVTGRQRSIPSTSMIAKLCASAVILVITEGEIPTSVIAMTKDGIVYSSLPLLSSSPALRWLATDDGMTSAAELTHSGWDGAAMCNVLAVASTGRTGTWGKLHVFRQSKQAAERTRNKG